MEMGGETDLPTINDQIMTGEGGPILGERCFGWRASCLRTAASTRDFWHEAGAAVIDPPLGFTRLVFGSRFKASSRVMTRRPSLRLRWGVSTDLVQNETTSCSTKDPLTPTSSRQRQSWIFP